MQITIIYGSSGGATGDVAESIAEKLSAETNVVDIANASNSDFEDATHLILGTSTWGDGELQDDWDDFFSNLDDIDFSGKKVAFFGLGDQDFIMILFLMGWEHFMKK